MRFLSVSALSASGGISAAYSNRLRVEADSHYRRDIDQAMKCVKTNCSTHFTECQNSSSCNTFLQCLQDSYASSGLGTTEKCASQTNGVTYTMGSLVQCAAEAECVDMKFVENTALGFADKPVSLVYDGPGSSSQNNKQKVNDHDHEQQQEQQQQKQQGGTPRESEPVNSNDTPRTPPQVSAQDIHKTADAAPEMNPRTAGNVVTEVKAQGLETSPKVSSFMESEASAASLAAYEKSMASATALWESATHSTDKLLEKVNKQQAEIQSDLRLHEAKAEKDLSEMNRFQESEAAKISEMENLLKDFAIKQARKKIPLEAAKNPSIASFLESRQNVQPLVAPLQKMIEEEKKSAQKSRNSYLSLEENFQKEKKQIAKYLQPSEFLPDDVQSVPTSVIESSRSELDQKSPSRASAVLSENSPRLSFMEKLKLKKSSNVSKTQNPAEKPLGSFKPDSYSDEVPDPSTESEPEMLEPFSMLEFPKPTADSVLAAASGSADGRYISAWNTPASAYEHLYASGVNRMENDLKNLIEKYPQAAALARKQGKLDAFAQFPSLSRRSRKANPASFLQVDQEAVGTVSRKSSNKNQQRQNSKDVFDSDVANARNGQELSQAIFRKVLQSSSAGDGNIDALKNLPSVQQLIDDFHHGQVKPLEAGMSLLEREQAETGKGIGIHSKAEIQRRKILDEYTSTKDRLKRGINSFRQRLAEFRRHTGLGESSKGKGDVIYKSPLVSSSSSSFAELENFTFKGFVDVLKKLGSHTQSENSNGGNDLLTSALGSQTPDASDDSKDPKPVVIIAEPLMQDGTKAVSATQEQVAKLLNKQNEDEDK